MKNTEKFIEVCHRTFLYDPTTSSCLRRRVNHRESSKTPSGPYRMVDVVVDGKRYTEYVHRIVWMLHHGVIPEGKVIDHIDRDKMNNTIENLRLVDYSDNYRNSERKVFIGGGRKRMFKKGKIEVTWSKSFRKDRVYIRYGDGTEKHLGYCNTPDEYKEIVALAKQKGLLKVLL